MMGRIRNLLYFSGYYKRQFRKLLGLKNTNIGNILFSIQQPSKVEIKAKLIGDNRIQSLPVRITQIGTASIHLEEGVTLRKGVSINAKGSGTINVGAQTTIGKGTSLETCGKASIFIGKNCRISWSCVFLPSDMHVVRVGGVDLNFVKDIVIGDHVWIGTKVIILKGTIIGNNCVVAAGAVCSGQYPDNSLIAGMPGKVIKSDVNWRNFTKEELSA